MRVRFAQIASLAALIWLVSIVTALAYQAEVVRNPGKLVGVVKFEGVAPTPAPLEVSKDRDVCGTHPLFDQSLLVGRDGGIANVVLTLPQLEKGAPLKPLPAVKFDQKGCEYTPHVAVFPAGSTVDVINSDGVLHNIHTESVANPVIDMAQPGFKKMITIRLDKPEAIKVTCDVHNWMEGWWYVTANPYYALTDAAGHYEIDGIPPGNYEVQAWQEKLGVKTQKVTIRPGGTTTADFSMSASK
jgi:plastocyanin